MNWRLTNPFAAKPNQVPHTVHFCVCTLTSWKPVKWTGPWKKACKGGLTVKIELSLKRLTTRRPQCNVMVLLGNIGQQGWMFFKECDVAEDDGGWRWRCLSVIMNHWGFLWVTQTCSEYTNASPPDNHNKYPVKQNRTAIKKSSYSKTKINSTFITSTTLSSFNNT